MKKKNALKMKKLMAKNDELKKALADVRGQLAKSEKKLTARNVELKKALADVRGQLTRAEKKLAKARGKAERWKKESAAQQAAASRSGARAKKLQKGLDRSAAAVQSAQSTEPMEPAASDGLENEPAADGGVAVPDETWSVVQLKAEARARGLVGLSNKPKAQLIAALS